MHMAKTISKEKTAKGKIIKGKVDLDDRTYIQWTEGRREARINAVNVIDPFKLPGHDRSDGWELVRHTMNEVDKDIALPLRNSAMRKELRRLMKDVTD
ncbi:hypothetical protein HPULCUR_006394 [Helicostylum pulchrum]|uniref:Uncharacterized protein n=1 Tax=Helicostylum pulchrum TaxID=562976 RepID=A0ABP9Y1S2_9FUNG